MNDFEHEINERGRSDERLQEAMRYLRERNRYILDKPVERRPGARPHLLTLIAEQIRREREMRAAMNQHGTYVDPGGSMQYAQQDEAQGYQEQGYPEDGYGTPQQE